MSPSSRKRSFGKILGIAAAAIFLAGLAALVFGVFSPRPPRIRNFILLSIDNLRPDRLGCYGNARDVSPVMDSLAGQGTLFTRAFTPFPFTPPSHIAMLTSLYPAVFSIPLEAGVPTLAQIMSRSGYRTAAFTGGGNMSFDYGVLNGFAKSDDTAYGLTALNRRSQRWLKANAKRKFFLFLHTYYVHVPWAAPEEYFRKFADPGYAGFLQFCKAARTRGIVDMELDHTANDYVVRVP